MASQVLRFESGDSDSDSNSENETNPRKKRKICEWELHQEFNSKLEAQNFLKEQKEWKYLNQYSTEKEEILKYVCRVSKACSSKSRIILPKDSLKASVEKTIANHDHEPKPFRGISDETKKIIDNLFEIGTTKPTTIKRALQQQNIIIKKTQIANYLASKRRNRGPKIISLGELQAEANKYSQLPHDLDEPYVDNSGLEFEENQKWFGVFLSTKRLLDIALQTQVIHCDATYKLSWEGFPVLVIGVSDKDRHFHPLGISVTASETTRDFEFLFRSMVTSVGHNYSPKILIADAAEAITNAFKTVFGDDFIRVFCWFHLCKNIDSHKSLVKDKNLWAGIKKNMSQLQLAKSVEEFNVAQTLFCQKYKESAKDFIEYFKNEHIAQRCGWYEGLALGYPSTNNGLESTNGWIKKQGTFRECLSMGDLFRFFMQQCKVWSDERNPATPDAKLFIHTPTLTLQMQTNAFQWMTKKPDIKYRTSGDSILHFISASGKPKLKEDDINKFLRMNEKLSWKSFDTYQQSTTRLWKFLVEFDNGVNRSTPGGVVQT
ncbi:hypothetical protein Fcan01_11709 [Folsomia candida]|uniref:MULE transposase domain-containing protein n=1 Tax=Folsomia candida TaxID=158441 RepID=A0A226EBP5_FOLCA|nr:hypothetical protein Fcan01_11709 [Folsomia candida]